METLLPVFVISQTVSMSVSVSAIVPQTIVNHLGNNRSGVSPALTVDWPASIHVRVGSVLSVADFWTHSDLTAIQSTVGWPNRAGLHGPWVGIGHNIVCIWSRGSFGADGQNQGDDGNGEL